LEIPKESIAIQTTRNIKSQIKPSGFIRKSERTRVDLEHRHLERHGDEWEQMRDTIGSPGGWPAEMRAFAELLES
jgi:hypothetical protein